MATPPGAAWQLPAHLLRSGEVHTVWKVWEEDKDKQHQQLSTVCKDLYQVYQELFLLKDVVLGLQMCVQGSQCCTICACLSIVDPFHVLFLPQVRPQRHALRTQLGPPVCLWR